MAGVKIEKILIDVDKVNQIFQDFLNKYIFTETIIVEQVERNTYPNEHFEITLKDSELEAADATES